MVMHLRNEQLGKWGSLVTPQRPSGCRVPNAHNTSDGRIAGSTAND